MMDDKKMKKRSNVEETWSNNMVLKKLLRPARYFDPLDDDGLTTDCSCDSCGELGHVAFNCPNPPPLRKRCYLCASFEHVGEHCSIGHDDDESCPEDGSITICCLRCGVMGHEMGLCKYEYTEDDLKDVQCYVCRSFGHLCCVEKSCDSLWDVSCYKCGQLGHVGLECGRYDSSSGFKFRPKKDSFGKRCKRRLSENELAEKKKKRIEKALAASAAIRDRLEKKKMRKLEEQEHSTLHDSNGKMNDGNFEQDSTLHESKGKTKKDNVESEQNFVKEGEEEQEN